MKRLLLPLLLLSCLGPIAVHAQTVVPTTTFSATVTVLGPTTVETGNGAAVTVTSSGNVTFRASTRIRLLPGFTASNGSTFHALIGPGATAAPVITSSAAATAIAGNAFYYTIIATNAPTSFNATGLPANVYVNPNTGAISGTPPSTGSFSVSLSASNAIGTGTRALTLTVSTGANSDSDGIPDAIEAALGTNPNSGATTDSSNQTNLKVHRPTP